jgi:hypothetical protein
MNLIELGALGEFIGSVAVLITLIYLAIQLRNNTKVVRAQTFEQRTNHLREMNTNTMNSDWYWQVLEKLDQHLPGSTHVFGTNADATVEDWEEALSLLNFEERGRFFVYALTQWNNLQNRTFQFEQGYETASTYESFESLAAKQANMYEALGITTMDRGKLSEVVREAVTHRKL